MRGDVRRQPACDHRTFTTAGRKGRGKATPTTPLETGSATTATTGTAMGKRVRPPPFRRGAPAGSLVFPLAAGTPHSRSPTTENKFSITQHNLFSDVFSSHTTRPTTGHAPLSQWQSKGLLNLGLWVRIPRGARSQRRTARNRVSRDGPWPVKHHHPSRRKPWQSQRHGN